MSDHDPLAEVIARLPDDAPSTSLRNDVERLAVKAFERDGTRLARFDRWMLGRVAPAVLSLCVLASAFNLVRYFARVFAPGPAASAGAQVGSSRPTGRAARVCGRTAIIGCEAARRPAHAGRTGFSTPRSSPWNRSGGVPPTGFGMMDAATDLPAGAERRTL